jgi:CHAT domain-containing protein/Tfp pilus assembly protein PilF
MRIRNAMLGAALAGYGALLPVAHAGPPDTPQPLLLADLGITGELHRVKLKVELNKARNRFGKDSLPAAKAEMDLAEDYFNQGEFNDALPLMRHAVAVGQHLLPPDDPRLGVAMYQLGATYYQFDDLERALPMAQGAADIGARVLDPNDVRLAKAYALVAAIYRDKGEYDKALVMDKRNATVIRNTKGPESVEMAVALNLLFLDFQSTGQYARARTAIQRAMAIGEKLFGADSDKLYVGMLNLSANYAMLGQYDLALPLVERALKAYDRKGPSHSELLVMMLVVHGRVLCALGRCKEGLAEAQRSVEVYEKLDNQTGRAYRCLISLAYIYEQLGRYADARAPLERALAVRQSIKGSVNPDLAFVMTLLAQVKLKLGDRDGALDLLQQALPIAVRGGNPEYLWRVQDALRDALAAGGQREPAIYWGKATINTVQSMRASLTGVQIDAQQSFVQDRRGAYKSLASLLIDAGRLAEAEQVLALLKDQELSQLVRRGDAPRPTADLVGAERGAEDEYEKLVTGEIERARELDALERRAKYEKLSDQDEARRKNLADEATDWRANFKKWLAALPARLASPSGAAAPSNQDINTATGALANVVKVDPDAVGLYYVVSDDYTQVIIATPRGSFGRRIPVKAVELNHRIADLRQALISPQQDPHAAAQALYRTLIEPISADLDKAQAHTLVLSLTDNLRYIPFAALYDGQHYLVERYAVAQVLAGAKPVASAARSPWQVSGFGMTQAAPPLAALRGVREELESIVQVPGTQRGVLPGTIALDGDFNREHLEAALRGEHRVLHIGSHFVLSATGDEESSYLLMGDKTPLTLGQIGTLDFSGVDQLTLSACNTANGGGKDQNGLEVEGMAAVVATQGAASVLASLWPVSDQSTATLMHAFYQGRSAGTGLSRAQALRQAQLGLLQGGGNFAHPFFWAPFIIMGNWL